VRYHGPTLSPLYKHPGFTAEDKIDIAANRLENVGTLTRSGWATVASVTANTLACGNNDMIVLTGAGGIINDIPHSLTATGIPIVIVRNGNAAAWTLTQKTAKLRCLGGHSVTLNQYECVTFAFVSGTVWGQVGGKTSFAFSELQSLPTTLAGYGITDADWQYGVLSADYVLTSTTAAQKLFNWSTNGSVTLQTGFYEFSAQIYISGMDPTSGNAKFELLGAGTAVMNTPLMGWSGVDSSTPSAAATRTGGFNIGVATGVNMSTSAVGTGLASTINGSFEVTAAGTIVPSISLVTAIAATVNKGSRIRFKRMGAVNTGGAWT